jgi:beta-fructofuranosidase
VTDDAGVPTAVYSAVADKSFRSVVLLARSDREMLRWHQDREPAAGMPDDPAISHARDPFLFEADGRRYAVQGAGHTHGRPRILVYGCDDLTSWTELGTLLSGDNPIAAEAAPANIWECPNLLPLGDRWILIISLWRHADGAHSLAGVRYLIGDLEIGSDGPRFTPVGGGKLDRGPCFYAPQVLRHDGRVLLWAWSWEHGRTREDIAGAGWAGALTFCRELSLLGDTLVSTPVPELAGLRQEALQIDSNQAFTATAYDVELHPDVRQATLCLVDGGDEQLVAEVELAPSPVVQPRILVDGSMIETFDGTATAYTTRAYPTMTSRWLLRLAQPAPISAWRLGPQ